MKINTRRKERSRRIKSAGFAMIESLVGSALIGISFVSLYAGIASGFQVVKLAREDLRATQIMLEKLETIRLYTFDQIETPDFIPDSFTEYYFPSEDEELGENASLIYEGTLTITDAPVTTSYADNLKSVVVTVEWESDGISRSREMQTFISEDGIQNYVYYTFSPANAPRRHHG